MHYFLWQAPPSTKKEDREDIVKAWEELNVPIERVEAQANGYKGAPAATPKPKRAAKKAQKRQRKVLVPHGPGGKPCEGWSMQQTKKCNFNQCVGASTTSKLDDVKLGLKLSLEWSLRSLDVDRLRRPHAIRNQVLRVVYESGNNS